ncbi:MAG: cell wall-binding repeat-containing protein [Actinomycetaceae bacterium]|nr:cell wall-binding repeat-containing protein [Actinomycetaceae bacterium]
MFSLRNTRRQSAVAQPTRPLGRLWASVAVVALACTGVLQATPGVAASSAAPALTPTSIAEGAQVPNPALPMDAAPMPAAPGDPGVCDTAAQVLDMSDCTLLDQVPSASTSFTGFPVTSGQVFEHVAGMRGAMETSWKDSWPYRVNGERPAETALRGVTVGVQWRDTDGSWSPIYTTKTGTDGRYSIAMRDYRDTSGVVHKFNGGSDQRVRASLPKWRSKEELTTHRLVWTENNGTMIHNDPNKTIVKQARWSSSGVSNYNFALSDQDADPQTVYNFQATTQVPANAQPVGRCNGNDAAWYQVTGNVWWDYIQNPETGTPVADWQPGKQTGDRNVTAAENYWVVAYLADTSYVDKRINGQPWRPDKVQVGLAPVSDDGSYDVKVYGTKIYHSRDKEALQRMLVKLVKKSGTADPAIDANGKLINAVPVDSRYGVWSPITGNRFDSFKDASNSGYGTGLDYDEIEQPGCYSWNTGEQGYNRLLNVNFALFPSQARTQVAKAGTNANVALEDPNWKAIDEAIVGEKIAVRGMNMQPNTTFDLFVGLAKEGVSVTSDAEGKVVFNDIVVSPAWGVGQNKEIKVVPSGLGADYASSIATLRVLPFDFELREASGQQVWNVHTAFTPILETAKPKMVKTLGTGYGGLQNCQAVAATPAGLSLAADCTVSGTPTISGVHYWRVKADASATAGGAVATVNRTFKIGITPVVLPQVGAEEVAGTTKSPLPLFAPKGQAYFGQVKSSNSVTGKANRYIEVKTAKCSVGGASCTLSELGDASYLSENIVDLGNGLTLNTVDGTVRGTASEGKVQFELKAKDAGGLVSHPQTFTITIADKLSLVRPHLPTAIAGQFYVNPSTKAPVYLWVQGGTGSYTFTEGEKPGTNAAGAHLAEDPFPSSLMKLPAGLKAIVTDGGAKLLFTTGNVGDELSGQIDADSITKPTIFNIPIIVRDTGGQVLKGDDTLKGFQNAKARATLDGSEGYVRLRVLPAILFKDGDSKLPIGTLNTQYPTAKTNGTDFKDLLNLQVDTETSGYYKASDYTYSAPGLSAYGLVMTPDGRIVGTPTKTTPSAGVEIPVTLSGKAGTWAERAEITLKPKLVINTNLAFYAPSYDLQAKAWDNNARVIYSTDVPLFTAKDNLKGQGEGALTYTLQYKDGSGNWVDTPKVKYGNGTDTGLSMDSQGRIIGTVDGLAGNTMPEHRVMIKDSDAVGCAPATACQATAELNITISDTRKPSLVGSAWTCEVGAACKVRLETKGGSGTGVTFEKQAKDGTDLGSLGEGTEAGWMTIVTSGFTEAGGPHTVNEIRVVDKNGNASDWTIATVTMVDNRVPAFDSTKLAAGLAGPFEEAVPVTTALSGIPLKINLKDGIPTSGMPPIKCITLVGAPADDCEKVIETGIPGVKLDTKTGLLSGVPHAGSAKDYPLALQIVGANGQVSNPATVTVTVNPTTLQFSPGIPWAGTTGVSYLWEFPPATGAETLNKVYRLLDKDDKIVEGVQFTEVKDTAGKVTKIKMLAPVKTDGKGLLDPKENYKLQVTAHSNNDPQVTTPDNLKVTRDTMVGFTFYDPVKITNTVPPKAAVSAPFIDTGGKPFVFGVTGGDGNYTFSIETGANTGHTLVAVDNDICPKDTYKLAINEDKSKPSGLCLSKSGKITGTPKLAGKVDFSTMKVEDGGKRSASLTGEKMLTIDELLVINSEYPGDKGTPAKFLTITKNDTIATEGLVIATVDKGSRPYGNLVVGGLDAYMEKPGDLLDPVLENFGVGDTGPARVVLRGKWTKIVPKGTYLNVSVTGAAGRTVSTQVYIEVETDLKFVDNPEPVPGSNTAGTKINIQNPTSDTSPAAQPTSIDDDVWKAVKDQALPGIPTLGLDLNKDAVSSGTPLNIPKLVEGGTGDLKYRIEPCNVKDTAEGKTNNCAIGDTGLFLDAKTGAIYGTPKPGANAISVVIVADSDTPPQEKKANLVVQLADTRLPKVTAVTVDASVGQLVNMIIPITDGSGAYKSCAKDPEDAAPSWLKVAWDGTAKACKATGTPMQKTAVTEETTLKIKVVDENGNSAPDNATSIKYKVTDRRAPVLNDWPTVDQAKENQSFTYSAPGNKDDNSPTLKSPAYSIDGTLPPGLNFSETTGQITGTVTNGTPSGDYPVTIKVTAANGESITKSIVIPVRASDLALNPLALVHVNAGASAGTKVGQITSTGGTGTHTYSITAGEAQLTDLGLELKGDEIVVAAGKTAVEGSATITIQVKDGNNVTRERTGTITIGGAVKVANPNLPIYSLSSDKCFTITGGTQPFTLDAAGNGGSGFTVEAFSGTPADPTKFCLNGAPSPATNGILEIPFKIKDGSVNPAAELKVKLPVSQEFSLKTDPVGTVEVTKGTALSSPDLSTQVSTKRCEPDAAYTACEVVPVRYSIENAPEGVSINPTTGVISGTPTKVTNGVQNATVTISDGVTSKTVTVPFEVKTALVFTAPATPKIVIGDTGTTDSGKPVATETTSMPTQTKGKYSIKDVAPDAQGDYPIRVDDKDTGLWLTPEGKIEGTLKPGVVKNNATITVPVVLTEDGTPLGSNSKPLPNGQVKQDVVFTVSDPRTPSMPTGTIISGEVGKAGMTGQLPFGGGSGAKDPTAAYSGLSCLPAATGLTVDKDGKWTISDTWIAKGDFTCTVTLKDFNGNEATGSFTLSMKDYRLPQFQDIAERYLWQGMGLSDYDIQKDWLKTGTAHPTAPTLSEVTIIGLPEGLKVYNGGAEVTAQRVTGTSRVVVNPDGTTEEKPVTSFTCDLTANKTCTIGHWSIQPAGSYPMTLIAKTDADREGSASGNIRVFSSPLNLEPKVLDKTVVATTGSPFAEAEVAFVNYVIPRDMPDTLHDRMNIEANWTNSYALGTNGGAKFEIADTALAGKWELSTGLVDTPAGTPKPCAIGSECKTKVLKLKSRGNVTDTGSVSIPIKVTDGHGLVRQTSVTIKIADPITFTRKPFQNTPADDVVTLPRATVGQVYRDAAGEKLRAEVKGGDGDYDTYLQYKEGSEWKYMKPVYCSLQGEGNYNRPKCFPVPGHNKLVPNPAAPSATDYWTGHEIRNTHPDRLASGLPAGTIYNADDYGMFLMTSGYFDGKSLKPEGDNAGNEATLAVRVEDSAKRFVYQAISIPRDDAFSAGTIAKLDDGKMGTPYPNTTVFTPAGGHGPYTCTVTGLPAGMTATCGDDPKNPTSLAAGNPIQISGTPTKSFDGSFAVSVKDAYGRTIDVAVPLKIESNLKFKDPEITPPAGGTVPPGNGTTVGEIDHPTQSGVKIPLITVTATTDLPGIKLPIDGGEWDDPDNPKPTYSLKDKDGNPVTPVDCPAALGNENVGHKCYPIGDTGLYLTDDGRLVGTPIPGKSAEGFVVAADQHEPPRTVEAKLVINAIVDKRAPIIEDMTINARVGEVVAAHGLVERVQSPALGGTDTDTTSDRWVTSVPTGAEMCGTGIGSAPTWLDGEKLKTGVVSSGATLVAHDAVGEAKFCVWYRSDKTGAWSKPAVVTVNTVDLRKPAAAGTQPAVGDLKVGDAISPAKKVLEWELPSDLVPNPAKPGDTLHLDLSHFDGSGSQKPGTPTIKNLEFSDLKCELKGGDATKTVCWIEVSGTPEYGSQGSYPVVGKLSVKDKDGKPDTARSTSATNTLVIAPYTLTLSTGPMLTAVVGQPYRGEQRPMSAGGGSYQADGGAGVYNDYFWFSIKPKDGVSGMSIDATKTASNGGRVFIKWTPSENDLKQAENGKIYFDLTVWDRKKCDERAGAGNLTWGNNIHGPQKDGALYNCPYQTSERLFVEIIAKLPTEPVTPAPVTAVEGGNGNGPGYPGNVSGSVTDPSGIGGTTYEIVSKPHGVDNVEVDANGNVKVTGPLPVSEVGKPHKIVIKIDIPGVPVYYREVWITVKPPVAGDTTPGSGSGGSGGVHYAVLPSGSPESQLPIERHQGRTRIETALAVLEDFAAGGRLARGLGATGPLGVGYRDDIVFGWSDTAILVRDDEYADSLVSGALAKQLNSPILLTKSDKAPEIVLDALRNHGFKKIIIVGGEGAVSADVARQFASVGFAVERRGGVDRFETAVRVADKVMEARGAGGVGGVPPVFLATGLDFADALSAGSAAMKSSGVILLTRGTHMAKQTDDWMAGHQVLDAVAVGGPAATAVKDVKRVVSGSFVGDDRYGTAALVAGAYFKAPARVLVATGTDFPDASFATTVSAKTGAPLTLALPVDLTKPTENYLHNVRGSVKAVNIIGGGEAINHNVETQVRRALY